MKSTLVMKIFFAAVFAIAFSTQASLGQCNSKKTHKVRYSNANYSPTSQNSYRSSTKSHSRDIVQLAAGSHKLSTLVAAVKAAGLVETLKSKGPFTVFAPTNDAFAALPEGTVETLLKPENKDQLIKVLTYHVVPGRIEANDLSSGKVASVEGSKINIDLSSSAVKINNAVVIDADNRAKNGVVHVIDRVILPPNM